MLDLQEVLDRLLVVACVLLVVQDHLLQVVQDRLVVLLADLLEGVLLLVAEDEVEDNI